VEKIMNNERNKFENWRKDEYGNTVGKFERLADGSYAHARVEIAYQAWLGRAKKDNKSIK
jgi:hypothetical protein